MQKYNIVFLKQRDAETYSEGNDFVIYLIMFLETDCRFHMEIFTYSNRFFTKTHTSCSENRDLLRPSCNLQYDLDITISSPYALCLSSLGNKISVSHQYLKKDVLSSIQSVLYTIDHLWSEFLKLRGDLKLMSYFQLALHSKYRICCPKICLSSFLK